METLLFLLKMVFISGAWDPLIDQHDPLIPSEEGLETWSSTMITHYDPRLVHLHDPKCWQSLLAKWLCTTNRSILKVPYLFIQL